MCKIFCNSILIGKIETFIIHNFSITIIQLLKKSSIPGFGNFTNQFLIRKAYYFFNQCHTHTKTQTFSKSHILLSEKVFLKENLKIIHTGNQTDTEPPLHKNSPPPSLFVFMVSFICSVMFIYVVLSEPASMCFLPSSPLLSNTAIHPDDHHYRLVSSPHSLEGQNSHIAHPTHDLYGSLKIYRSSIYDWAFEFRIHCHLSLCLYKMCHTHLHISIFFFACAQLACQI